MTEPQAVLLSKTGKLTLEELALVPTPAATATHRPKPHHDVVNALIETLGFRHIAVHRTEFAVDKTGNKVFGIVELDHGFIIPRFRLGIVVATSGALHAVLAAGQTPAPFLRRHLAGDWGDLDAEDSAENERSVAEGFRILSAYRLSDSTRIWIITEADRSSTCILLPEEY